MNPEVVWDPELASRHKSITLNILIWTLRLGETLKLTHVTSQLYRMFYALRLVDTLNLTHFTNRLYRIFWLVYPEGGWDPGLDSCYKSIIYNVLNWKPWGWVRPWTWLMLQVDYIECLSMNPEVRWDPELDSRYKSITLNILIWTLRLGETLKLTHVTSQLHWIFWYGP